MRSNILVKICIERTVAQKSSHFFSHNLKLIKEINTFTAIDLQLYQTLTTI
jgi:hypothetical protein